MSEKTAVELTQAGKRITFSAGYIIAISPFKFLGKNWTGETVILKCAVLTNLGITFVDQDYQEVGLRLQEAMQKVDRDPRQNYGPCALTSSHPLGNEAEF